MKSIGTDFKRTDIGLIPADWQVQELRDILQERGYIRGPFGSSLRRPELKTEGIPVYEQEHAIYKRRTFRFFIDSEKFRELSRFTVQKDDLIVSCSGVTLGKVSLISEEDPKGIISQALLTLRPDTKKVDPLFLFFFFDSKQGFDSLASRSLGSAQPNLASREIIEQIRIPIPPYEEQHAISKFLSDLDSMIQLNKLMNRTIEEIAKAIFKRWFIEFEFPHDQGKTYKSSGGALVDSDLGKIPKNWRIGKLAEFVNTVKGCSYRSEDLKESQTALVTLKSFDRGGGFNQDGYKPYVGDYDEEQLLKNGEVIVAQTDLTQKAEVIGRPAIVNSLARYSKLVASLDLQIVRPKENSSRNYLYYLLSTDDFHNHALAYTNGTTVLHLNKNALPDYVAIIPPAEILDKFDKIINSLLDRSFVNSMQIETLSRFRDNVLPKIMSGKIRVPIEIR